MFQALRRTEKRLTTFESAMRGDEQGPRLMVPGRKRWREPAVRLRLVESRLFGENGVNRPGESRRHRRMHHGQEVSN